MNKQEMAFHWQKIEMKNVSPFFQKEWKKRRHLLVYDVCINRAKLQIIRNAHSYDTMMQF